MSLSDLIRQIEGWVTANYARMTSVARTYEEGSRAG
jgi:hypothetical protein